MNRFRKLIFGVSVQPQWIFFHQETKTGDTTAGQYRVALPDGRMQVKQDVSFVLILVYKYWHILFELMFSNAIK